MQVMDDPETWGGQIIRTSHNGTEWTAVLDNYDGAPDSKTRQIGTGPTPEAAIEDLKQWLEIDEARDRECIEDARAENYTPDDYTERGLSRRE